jgi:hypothetical protein
MPHNLAQAEAQGETCVQFRAALHIAPEMLSKVLCLNLPAQLTTPIGVKETDSTLTGCLNE